MSIFNAGTSIAAAKGLATKLAPEWGRCHEICTYGSSANISIFNAAARGLATKLAPEWEKIAYVIKVRITSGAITLI